MGNDYTIQINIDNNTLEKLYQQGFYLRIFKGVKTSICKGGFCTVWMETNDLSNTVTVGWNNVYAGYVAFYEELEDRSMVTPASSEIMALNDILNVYNNGITTISKGDGEPDCIIVKNRGTEEWNCGISQEIEGVSSPTSVFPLIGYAADIIMPLEKVLLVFESGSEKAGRVVSRIFNESIVVEFDTAHGSRTISYNINNGWDAGEAAWATIYRDIITLSTVLNECFNPLEAEKVLSLLYLL